MILNYSLADLESLAKKLIKQFESYRIFCFEGELGAGKTTLIESLCRCLGSTDPLSSPTFSIINEYNSPMGELYHMDWYRLKNEEEAIQIGIEDYLFSGNYCFIEWYQNAESLIPRPYVRIQLSNEEETKRVLTVNIIE
ncbi:MAG: tRNA (adenosine(37)-N6)-threonylcarbamoyltransferase complex ATPase subunit type 1 TsaE [Chitinophagales bacterium]|jgi:tRNA threonylcarbamoyladenosine biosynthesis protein TsaE|nr:tRNA (adenosine(37)-N6)-threonylcarbamoyltransferase complex ATPase subunit type 1 TsaE [Sphingobacteriales bacterium]